MKKISILMVAMLLGATSLFARPGYSKPVDVPQPDGSTVTLLMHGDEYLSFMTTIDGYTVMRCDDGYYRYADKTAEGWLAPTSVIARNPEARSAQDISFLAARQKMIAPRMTETKQQLKAMASQMYAPVELATGGPTRSVSIWSRINYDNFKGLVVLVNWNDREFTLEEPVSMYQQLTNQSNLTGNVDGHYPVNVTGSARDYFYANSLGIFDPTFDVVGPVTINYSCEYPCPQTATGQDDPNYSRRMINIIKAVMNQLNATINFGDYDLDSNGYIDMVYFIFAGYGSYMQGNSYKYIWPHANDFSSIAQWEGMRYDGKKFGRYACSVEIQDLESLAASHQYLDGIGTICHEFSHVLGLADHYDTDYAENGQSNDPGGWDIMADGADYNYALTPVGYNAFERHVLGFVEPQVLTEAGSYSLGNFATDNEAFILKTGSTDDDFYLENRQKTGWDAHLPGHGLLVWRADTSNPNVWKENRVNCVASHNYFVMTSNPTAAGLRELTSDTEPALTSWAGQPAVQDLFDIIEEDGVVTFNAGKNLYEKVIEDFEECPLSDSGTTGITGKYCAWDLDNATIEERSGSHVVKLMRTGALNSSEFEKGIRSLKFTVKNDAAEIRFVLRTSSDGGTTWTNFSSQDKIKKNQEKTYLLYDVPANCKIQFFMQATTASAVCYLDDIEATFFDNEIPTPPVTGIEGLTHNLSPKGEGSYYTLDGRLLNGEPTHPGIYIVNGKKRIVK